MTSVACSVVPPFYALTFDESDPTCPGWESSSSVAGMDCERMELQIGGWAEVGDLVGAHLVSPEQRVQLRESSASRLPSLPPLKIRPDALVNGPAMAFRRTEDRSTDRDQSSSAEWCSLTQAIRLSAACPAKSCSRSLSMASSEAPRFLDKPS